MPIPSGGLIHKYDLLDPACYPGSGTLITDTVGSLDLTTTGSPTYNATLGSLTWNANGVGAYSTPGQYANTTTNFTISIWVRINDASVSQLIFNNGNRAGAMSGYSSFFDGTGSDLVDFGGNNIWGMNSGSALAQDQWYNLTYTLNSGTNEAKIYINGVLSATTNNGSVSYGPNDFLALGGTGSSTGSPTLQNKASYAVVLIYNTTLNATQVLDIYNSYAYRFASSVAKFDFSNVASYPGSGGILYDLSGTGNTLTNPTLTGTFGGTGQSKYYSFAGGTDQFARTASAGFSGTTLYTASVFAWVRASNWNNPPQDSGYHYIMGWGDDVFPGGGHIGLAKQYSTTFYPPGQPGTMGSGYGVTFVPGGLTNNKWQHFGYVADGTNCTLYLDGVQVGQTPQTYNYVYGNTGPLAWVGNSAPPTTPFMSLGALAGGGYAPASNFDLAIGEWYNVGLGSTTVAQLYNSQKDRFIAPICSFDFSNATCFNGTGTAVNDLSAFNNDFTLDNTNYTFFTTYGGEILIDQTNTLVRAANLNNYAYGVSAYTVIIWMQQNSQGASNFNMFHVLQETGGTGSNNTIYFGTKPGAPGNMLFASDGSVNSDTAYDFPLNTWKMVAFTKQYGAPSADTHIYIDGVEIAQTWSGSSTINFTTGFPCHFDGVDPSLNFWNCDMTIGQIDIYPNYFEAADIVDYYINTEARYSAPAPPPFSNGVNGRTFGQGFAG